MSRDDAAAYDRHKADVDGALLEPGHKPFAELYAKLVPCGAAYSVETGWTTCDARCVWVAHGSGVVPPALRRSVGDVLRAHFRAAQQAAERGAGDGAAALLRASAKAVAAVNSAPYLSGVVMMLQDQLLDEGLHARLNAQPHLLAFTDAVVDLDTRDVRAIAPGDYVSVTTGYPYPTVPDADADARVRAFLRSMFEDDRDVACLLRYLAAQLHGSKPHELFYIWKGPPRAGKGALAALLARALGGYAGTWQVRMLTTRKSAPEGAEPALLAARYARVMVTTEPEPRVGGGGGGGSDAALQTGFVKQLVGRDPILCRAMYSGAMVSLTPGFGLIIQTNGVLTYNAVDPALTCKQRIVPFKFTFVDAPTAPDERKRDNGVKSACAGDPAWRDAFVRLLLAKWFDEVAGAATLAQSPAFAAATRAYAVEADPVEAWLADSYVVDAGRVGDRATWKSTEELHSDFRAATGCELGVQAWAARMKELGVPKSANAVRLGGAQARYWLGLVVVDAVAACGVEGSDGGTGGGGGGGYGGGGGCA